MPDGGVIGTSSMRRGCQLKALYPGLEVRDIRGNVGTRLKKLDSGGYDALILASAGLTRLGHAGRITLELGTDIMLPAIGQGALGIEVRAGDDRTRELVGVLNDDNTMLCVNAERMVNRRLNGGCLAPIAAHAVTSNHMVAISAMVGSPDGTELIRSGIAGPEEKARELGDKLGMMLLDKGAARILEEIGIAERP
jgi:hydroxymethylbilane synthase